VYTILYAIVCAVGLPEKVLMQFTHNPSDRSVN